MRSPRYGPGFVLYFSSRHGPQGLWKLANGAVTEIWRGDDGGVIGPPSVTSDGGRIAFAVHKNDRNTAVCGARGRLRLATARKRARCPRRGVVV